MNHLSTADRHPDRPLVAIFASFSGRGGVERMLVNLAEGLLELGCRVDILAVKDRSEYLQDLPAGVRLIRLGTTHTYAALFPLAQYIQSLRPAALLSAKNRANQVAVAAKIMARVPVRVVLRMGTTTSAALKQKSSLRLWWWSLGMRITYPRADAVIAVSKGVAEDLRRLARVPENKLKVVANPVITPRLFALAKSPATHPWLKDKDRPVILAAGRLTRQKDFPTLIRAFAQVRRQIPSRLIILGEGEDRSVLESLIKDLGLEGQVDLPGFVQNPYAYMSRADIFVLSSLWEGSPNVLTEALALGVPSVATDCPSGPREILAEGRYGELVPMGNASALAQAILRTLRSPLPRDLLKEAVQEYHLRFSAQRYLKILLGED
ncbi:glycosyltransferase [Thermosulfuriphilus ammonigenes]|uniref:Glycosyltransferase n=1 Tax=Thermosulfuriphilus ammonigenes TaxID=1936021 RepID=A0A6G7PYJ1_9BACT|nr:glycosyltransferase [Thermosulfuriphilus ammonigenes]MBA2849082.1 glycosyltransferase involved in cell wall biosynthesis [Thermosulfuriphilus ammonigenes]QIJ72765.1 glycosyltransferase [Thermosulfuriphilus ammonigenes]